MEDKSPRLSGGDVPGHQANVGLGGAARRQRNRPNRGRVAAEHVRSVDDGGSGHHQRPPMGIPQSLPRRRSCGKYL